MNNSHFCGASIIQPLLLLTAAHCITVLHLHPSQIRAVAGEHDLSVDGEYGEQLRNVSKIIIHDGWNSTTWENDIAIIQLDEPFELSNYVQPIDIAEGDEIPRGNEFASISTFPTCEVNLKSGSIICEQCWPKSAVGGEKTRRTWMLLRCFKLHA